MSSEVKEINEDEKDEKRVKRLPVPFSYKSRQALELLQDQYKLKYRKRITRADIAGKIFETLRKNGMLKTMDL